MDYDRRCAVMEECDNTVEDVAGCPIRNVIAVIACKWPMLVVHSLNDYKPKYFGELNKAIPDVSPKMLSQALKLLVSEDLVSRTVIPDVPPRTQYQLTDYGKTLIEATNPLIDWAFAHMNRKK